MGRSAPVWEFSRRCRNGWPPGCRLRFGQAESVWRQSCLRRELILAKAADLGLRLDDFGATRALDMVSALQFPFFQNWIVFGYIQYMDYRDKRYEHAIGDPPYRHLSFPPSHVYGGQTQRRHPQIYQKKEDNFRTYHVRQGAPSLFLRVRSWPRACRRRPRSLGIVAWGRGPNGT